jgi:hypothetical protein
LVVSFVVSSLIVIIIVIIATSIFRIFVCLVAMSLLLRLLICSTGINHDLAMSTILRCLRIRLLIVVMVARIFIRLLRVLFLIVGLIIITSTSSTSTSVCVCVAPSTLFVRLLLLIAS